MKYNGKELIEMTPEKWDGKCKFMLVWNSNHEETMPRQREVVEWYKNKYGYVIWRDVYNTYWNYCAEIPKEETMNIGKANFTIDECIKMITNRADYWYPLDCDIIKWLL